jgi:hypothetical protein
MTTTNPDGMRPDDAAQRILDMWQDIARAEGWPPIAVVILATDSEQMGVASNSVPEVIRSIVKGVHGHISAVDPDEWNIKESPYAEGTH